MRIEWPDREHQRVCLGLALLGGVIWIVSIWVLEPGWAAALLLLAPLVVVPLGLALVATPQRQSRHLSQDESTLGSGVHLIFYDGVCGLCNRFNRFVLDRDRKDGFRFAPLQGPLAHELLGRHGRNASDLDTVYVLANYQTEQEVVLCRSRAVLFVAGQIGGIWKLPLVFSVLPTVILDAAYNFVARRRYRWFGKYDQCPVPKDEDRAKFIDGV